ncbi:MAG: sensor histidine kinase [Lachnospiraceae bacterium]|nr:sensor histidine kinase [Lachnospiraceae bacterium]
MRKKSLSRNLIRIFVLTSIVPILLITVILLYNTFQLIQNNTRVMMQMSLEQADQNMNLRLEACRDILLQMYTDDSMVSWTDKLSRDEDTAVTVNQMRRYLSAVMNSRDYIRAITVITENDMMITCHRITSATYENPWLDHFSLPKEELYRQISSDSRYHYFPTEYATRFAGSDYYLFHIAHRIIDYRNLEKQCGIIVISLDESLLGDTLLLNASGDGQTDYCCLLGEDGRVISHPDKSRIGEHMDQELTKSGIYTYTDEALGWKIVSVTDQSRYGRTLTWNLGLIAGICLTAVLVAVMLVLRQTGRLVSSVNRVVTYMQQVGSGDLSVRVPEDEDRPAELDTVAEEFNRSVTKLENAQEKEREANEKRIQAELKALEAQINPHFLYNTLDTINWMAIEKDAFDISNAINSLATILRYAITDYGSEVPIRDEIEWLKRYVYLQQYRLKNTFVCNIHVEPELMEEKIHKLLLQPFVENSIIHGFGSEQGRYVLDVIITREGNMIRIVVRDNGKGIPPDVLQRIRENDGTAFGEEKEHMGLHNAITRFRMYTGGLGTFDIASEPGQGTAITLIYPAESANTL